MRIQLLFCFLFVILFNATRAQIFDTLPVIVHVIHNGEAVGTGKNISQAQVYSQFDVLNEDYRMLNADIVNTPSVFMPFVADMGLNFEKALVDPNGNTLAEPGIDRIDRNAMGWTIGPYTMNYVDNTIKPQTIWDPTQYLNIWVVTLSTGLLGYSTLPANSGLSCMPVIAPDSTRDGIVVHYTAFGRTGNVLAPYDKGRTATYEIAKWLGLRVLAQSSCGDDCVADTPLGDYNLGGCPVFPQVTSCNNGPDGEMFMNFMSYVDDGCKVMFTQGQKSRIDTTLTNGTFQSALRLSSVPAGIKEQDVLPLCFYPNPSQGQFTLRLAGNERCNVTVYSIVGERLFETVADPSETLSLPGSLANGAYFISIISNKNSYTGKISLSR